MQTRPVDGERYPEEYYGKGGGKRLTWYRLYHTFISMNIKILSVFSPRGDRHQSVIQEKEGGRVKAELCLRAKVRTTSSNRERPSVENHSFWGKNASRGYGLF